jgi:hypothetical protein
MAEGSTHELVGGLAVLVHVEEADSTHSILTRDNDLMIQRSGLALAANVWERFQHQVLFLLAERVDPPGIREHFPRN